MCMSLICAEIYYTFFDITKSKPHFQYTFQLYFLLLLFVIYLPLALFVFIFPEMISPISAYLRYDS